MLVTVVADLHYLDKDAFWTVCDHKSWAHPYDAEGVRQHFKDIPKSVDALADDPYRSLAGELRRAGGFAKDTTRSASSCGPTSCGGTSRRSGSRATSPPPWSGRWRWRNPRTPTTCPAGADR